MGQRLMWIAWPAFLVAAGLELMVFAMIDPEDIHWFGRPLDISRTGIYSLAFFFFWAAAFASSALTTLLAASPFEINRCPMPETQRPEGCPKRDEDCADCA